MTTQSGFAGSCENIHLEGNSLVCLAQTTNGNWENVTLDLNTVLGNNNGSFEAKASGWADTGRNPKLDVLDNGGILLTAELQNLDGDWAESQIDLNQCLGNDNGKLVV